MKKKCFLFLLVITVCLVGCTRGVNINIPDNINQDADDVTDSSVTQNVGNVEILGVNAGCTLMYESDDSGSVLLAKSKFSGITLDDEYAGKYPLLSQKLRQVLTMMENAMTDEYDNFLASAKNALQMHGFGNWKAYVSTLDTQVRRADSVAFSTLSDSYTDTPMIENVRSFMGSSYDTQTGEELLITDVVKDMSKLADIVKKEITSHMWTGEFKDEAVLEEFFKNTAPSDIYWTLDYNGVTFYFYAGCIANEEYGNITATVSFAEYPELFVEKYTVAPESYAVRIPVTSSFFTDLDGDTELDELVFTALKDEETGLFTDAYIITADGFYEEKIPAFNFSPYYIKAADDRHFLYVFSEGAEDFNRLMNLYIYEITDGKIDKLIDIPLALHHSVDDEDRDVFALPVNPESMLLDVMYVEDGFSYPKYTVNYRLDSDGMPSNTVTVGSVDELLRAVSTGANIKIKKGKYNLSEYINTLTEKDIEDLSTANPSVSIRECFDGYEVVFMNVSDVTIFGETENANDTEFVTDYRYATVFCFANCSNISLSDVKLGHTEMGECEGDVLNFSGCNNINIRNTDLYGCGVYGIVADSYSGEFYVSGSRIHDCSNGPVYISEGLGSFTFFDCSLVDSDAGGVFEKTPDSALSFYNCTFGKRETEHFMFRDDIYTENCTWSEDIEYPEFGYEYTQLEEALLYFEPDIMEMIPFDEEDLADTYWEGYMRVIQESGNTVTLPQYIEDSDELYDIDVEFYSDGKASVTYGTQKLTGKWYGYDNDEYSICIALDEGHNAYVSLFAKPDTDGAVQWMMLQLDENLVWMYKR